MSKEEPLIWRLKEKPTAEGVASLVEMGVITKDEAREILFSEAKGLSEEEVNAYKEQIEFYQGLIEKMTDKLATRNLGYVYQYSTPNRYWTDTKVFMSNLGMDVSSGSLKESYYVGNGTSGTTKTNAVNTLTVG